MQSSLSMLASLHSHYDYWNPQTKSYCQVVCALNFLIFVTLCCIELHSNTADILHVSLRTDEPPPSFIPVSLSVLWGKICATNVLNFQHFNSIACYVKQQWFHTWNKLIHMFLSTFCTDIRSARYRTFNLMLTYLCHILTISVTYKTNTFQAMIASQIFGDFLTLH